MRYPVWFSTVMVTLGMVAATTEVAAQSNRLVEKSHVDASGSAFTSYGKVKVDLQEVRTEVEGVKGPVAISVLVIHDPSSGAYTWRSHTADPANSSLRLQQFNDSQAAFLKDREITDFMALPSPLRLLVNQSSDRTRNMREAVSRSLKEAGDSVQRGLETGKKLHLVSLSAIGRDFTSNPMSVTVFDVLPRVTNVQWDGKHWIVTLMARWAEEVVLDRDFKVISVRKVGN